jgi:hypothetical protein
MSETDRKLGKAEQELEQAIDALRQCKDALDGALVAGINGGAFVRMAEQAKLQADFILALHARRRIGTECAAVGRDVLLAGLGVTK